MTTAVTLKRQAVVQELNQLFDPSSYTGRIVDEAGTRGLLYYLKTAQPYSIATTPVGWSSLYADSDFFSFAHHAMIRLPGKRLCEWTTQDTSWEAHRTQITQLEKHQAPGKTIEAIWRTHCQLSPKYRQLGTLTSAPEGLIHYRPFKNDCFCYVNRVLKENNQPATKLVRFNPKK